ncbi:MAG: hypothetical protein V4436_00610 [Patescibacteria group bacterium]
MPGFRRLNGMQKALVAIVFLILILAGGTYLFTQKSLDNNPPLNNGEIVACTMEAKLCPDGVTYVGRQGPNCEFAACPATSTTTNGTSSSPLTIETQINKKITALGLSLTPLEVVEDSRCPTNVQCIQAGTVRVKVLIQSGLGEGAVVVTLNTPITTEAEEITLISVSPAPLSTHEITKGEYRFVFKVMKRS